MASKNKSILKSRKLSSREAKRVARNLQRATVISSGRTKSMKPLSLRSTATGKGTVVFRASRVLSSLAGVAKS
jgi:hypothetical protein